VFRESSAGIKKYAPAGIAAAQGFVAGGPVGAGVALAASATAITIAAEKASKARDAARKAARRAAGLSEDDTAFDDFLAIRAPTMADRVNRYAPVALFVVVGLASTLVLLSANRRRRVNRRKTP